ncbi:MAG: class II fructose-bisphosphate aldolase [Amaricoccus sp.]
MAITSPGSTPSSRRSDGATVSAPTRCQPRDIFLSSRARAGHSPPKSEIRKIRGAAWRKQRADGQGDEPSDNRKFSGKPHGFPEVRAIRGGFSSVMFDGSSLSLEENVAQTAQVVEIAHKVGVTVEGEVGTIGMTDEFGAKLKNAHLSDPDSAGAAGQYRYRLASRSRSVTRTASTRHRAALRSGRGNSQADLDPDGAARRHRYPEGPGAAGGLARRREDERWHRAPLRLRLGGGGAFCDSEPVKDLPLMKLGSAASPAAPRSREYMGITMSEGRLN